jgi:hypothetical protein
MAASRVAWSMRCSNGALGPFIGLSRRTGSCTTGKGAGAEPIMAGDALPKLLLPDVWLVGASKGETDIPR